MHAELGQRRFGLHHHVKQVRHRRALVAADIGHARLQQSLGHGQNAFSMEGLALSEHELVYLAVE